MIRDNNKDRAYFDEHIALNDAAIAKRLDVETFPNVEAKGVLAGHVRLYMMHSSAAYSRFPKKWHRVCF